MKKFITIIWVLLIATTANCNKESPEGLKEEGCRASSEYIPVGEYMREYLTDGGEVEEFIFKKCIKRTPKYQNCEEIVELSPTYGSSKFPVECRCCYDENYNSVPLEP